LTVSDGVTDWPNSDVGMFGEDGLEEFMHDLWNIRGAAFFDAFIWSLTASVESDDFPDDLSGILFESSD
jgi:sigma-B regulation protein RsbU (phosphoserine phosphatase)